MRKLWEARSRFTTYCCVCFSVFSSGCQTAPSLNHAIYKVESGEISEDNSRRPVKQQLASADFEGAQVADEPSSTSTTHLHIRGQDQIAPPQLNSPPPPQVPSEFARSFATSNVIAQPVGFELQPYQPSNDVMLGPLTYDPSLPSTDNAPLAVPQDRLSLPKRLWNDQVHFYSPDSLVLLGGGFALGAIGANTGLDDSVQEYSQAHIGESTKDLFHQTKNGGDQNWTVPIYATAWAAGSLFSDSERMGSVGTWGERSFRGMLVGFPPLLGLQRLTGASRPGETSDGSQWNPFQDNNGVSGHSFVGAMPFITAAKMTDSRGKKALLYAGSTIVPISRVLDNAHYPSQIVLGWWVAYLAASAVDLTENPDHRWRLTPYSTGESTGILAEFKY